MNQRPSRVCVHLFLVYFVSGTQPAFAADPTFTAPRRPALHGDITHCPFNKLPPEPHFTERPTEVRNVLKGDAAQLVRGDLSRVLNSKSDGVELLTREQQNQALADANAIGPKAVLELVEDFIEKKKGHRRFDYDCQLVLRRAISLWPDISQDFKPLLKMTQRFIPQFNSQMAQRNLFLAQFSAAEKNPEAFKSLLLQMARDNDNYQRFGSEDWHANEVARIFKLAEKVMATPLQWSKSEIAILDTWLEGLIRAQMVRVPQTGWSKTLAMIRGSEPKYVIETRDAGNRAVQFATARYLLFRHLYNQGSTPITRDDVTARANQLGYYKSTQHYLWLKNEIENYRTRTSP